MLRWITSMHFGESAPSVPACPPRPLPPRQASSRAVVSGLLLPSISALSGSERCFYAPGKSSEMFISACC